MGASLLLAPGGAAAYERVHTLRWTQPDGGTPAGYAVSLGAASGQYGETRDLGAVAAGGDGVRRADLVLEAFEDYYVVLTAYNAAGSSPRSNEVLVERAACDATFCEDGNACTADACGADACAHERLPDGTACGNGLCDGGVCVAAQCIDHADCGDGNACNGVEVCVGSRCQAGAAPSCSGETACTVSSCDPTLGCVTRNKADGTSCNDGNAATTADRCTAGTCAGRPVTPGDSPGHGSSGGSGKQDEAFCAVSCDDGDPCTANRCVQGACQSEPAPAGTACDDGDPITVSDMCSAGSCRGTPQVAPMCQGVSCEDGNSCTIDACAKGSCTHLALADGTRCDDGNRRTSGDRCVAGVCRSKGRSAAATSGKWRQTRQDWDTRYWWGKPRSRR
jgi:hypothetical protein